MSNIATDNTAPDHTIASNPLLDFSDTPRYRSIQPSHVTPAIEALLSECRATVQRVLDGSSAVSWESLVGPLDDAHERLSRAWGAVSHLHGVDDNPAIREAYNDNLPAITQYWTELGQNLALFERYKALAASSGFAALDPAQRTIINNELRDFKLGGAELPADKKRRYAAIQEELSALSAKFSENLLDATNAFSLNVTDAADVSGIPADDLQSAAEAATKAGQQGWRFSLHAPSYLPVMQYAENRSLRERMYRASSTRASEFGPAELDNTPLIQRLLRLRRELAQLLDMDSYAELSLVAKMADKPSQVVDFLEDLANKAMPFGRADMAELTAFAKTELGLDTLQSWDVAWASEKLRQHRYAFSDQEVKQYFPEPVVLGGMFQVVERIYGIRVEAAQAEVWHPQVRYFRIADADNATIGHFYIDLYARQTKRGGAWMDEARSRRKLAAAGDRPSSIQTPVAYLVCNFPAPVGEYTDGPRKGQPRPALFTHDDVITLFHEFGHGLHHLLSQVDHLGVSGIRGVEWDAVELPSQFMENFCWEWEVLSQMTAHVDSGEPLPRTLFERMLAARNFQSGMQMLRQIEFSLFDMRLHHDFNPAGQQSVQQLLDQIRQQVAVMIPPDWNRFPNSFGHIFSGGYSAGYYSYKWAEVLSADAYSAFEEARLRGLAEGTGRSVLDPDTGARFRREVLSVGGSRPALQSFQAFRGRAPNADALLRHSGMTVERAEDGAATAAA
jgi:oligopeptidase A